MSNLNETRILRLSSHDEDSYGFLDYYLTRLPNGNLQVYVDNILVVDIHGHEKADFDELSVGIAS